MLELARCNFSEKMFSIGSLSQFMRALMLL